MPWKPKSNPNWANKHFEPTVWSVPPPRQENEQGEVMLILITPSDVVVLVWENNENIPRIPAVMSNLLITLFKATLIIYRLHKKMRARCDMRESPRVKTTASTTLTDSLWMIMEGMKDTCVCGLLDPGLNHFESKQINPRCMVVTLLSLLPVRWDVQ